MESKRSYKLAVIMSTFNGEKYISEQINSILNQKTTYDVSIQILVRDDMSVDGTVKLISEIAGHDQRVKLVDSNNENLGVKASFFKLLSIANDFDLVFFSDQDDVWNPDKVEEFMNKATVENVFTKTPAGIYSDAWISDALAQPTSEKMSTRYDWKATDVSYQFLSFNYRIVGATYAINDAAVKLVNEVPTEWTPKLNMHDSFIGLLISIYGKNYCINQPLVYYRQHGNNLVGAGTKNKFINQKIGQAIGSIKQLISDDLLAYRFMEIKGAKLLDKSAFKQCMIFFNEYVRLSEHRFISRQAVIQVLDPYIWKRHYFFAKLMLYVLKFDVKE